MCRFFLLRRQSDPKELGVKNGIKQAEILKKGYSDPEKYNYLIEVLGTNSYWHIKDSVDKLDIELQYVELLPGSKLTDFLQFGPALINCPFLISNSVSSVFSRHNIGNCTLFSSVVTDKVHEYPYFLCHFSRMPDNIIDFSRSLYFTGNIISGKQMHNFSSVEEKNNFLKENINLKAEVIYLSESFDASLDLFVMSDSEIVVSEKLKDDLIRSKCYSGVKFLPAFGTDLQWVAVNHEPAAK
jgi:hypothetical protein